MRKKTPPEVPSEIMPLLPLRGMIIFPKMATPLEVGRERSVHAVEEAMIQERKIVLAAQKEAGITEPSDNDVFSVGIVAEIKQLLKMPEGHLRILVEGLKRCRIVELVQESPFYQVRAHLIDNDAPEPVEEAEEPSVHMEALVRAARRQFEQYVKLSKKLPAEALHSVEGIHDLGMIADLIAGQLAVDVGEKQHVLETLEPEARLERVTALLTRELEILEVEKRIQLRVRKQMEKSQKEYYLREQLKAIQKELGDQDERSAEVEDLKDRIEEAKMTEAAKEKALHELGRLEKMPPMAAEAVVVRNYLDWMISLPWNKKTKDRLDLTRAERILNEDHYGLDKMKERILEFLAVRKLVKKLKGPILCLVGPPGVGKTSLGKSVARALNRKFVRFSLGGVRDEAEIRGHRRTYVGALPGKIVQVIREAGSKNPVILLDEIDKMSMDFRGDPSAALLEVLDPEQNANFGDHYLETPFDLSDVLFITTANVLPAIPQALRDRMEIIEIPGYTEDEKLQIALRHLLPRQLEQHGLDDERVQISENTVRTLILNYTREAGVRSLERNLAAICRKAARQVVGGKDTVRVTVRTLENYLGPKRFRHTPAEKQPRVGVTTGLAYTQVGGDLLDIEVTVVPGKGRLTLTGKLGDVMRESAQAAFSYVRSRAKTLGIVADFNEKVDIHIHVPEGAVPKDGPSAGITIATSLVSSLTGRPVRSDVAMTGEITLRGRILPIGGLKVKLLAAHRAGIHTLLIPSENGKDLSEIPGNIRRHLNIHLVKHLDEVLEIALFPAHDADQTDADIESAPGNFDFIPGPITGDEPHGPTWIEEPPQ